MNSFPKWHDKDLLHPSLTKHERDSGIDDGCSLQIKDVFPNEFPLQRIFKGIFRQNFSKNDAGCLLALFRNGDLLLLLN